MTTPERTQTDPEPDQAIARMLRDARPGQVQRLLDDIRKTGGDGFPPVQGTA